mmetsp:Transcript_123248/g.331029  ORF Transcript_123248/g.331029 Transcript_123248/m.331029 type:complete len:207 (-) Transcript_123248:149-769(-)
MAHELQLVRLLLVGLRDNSLQEHDLGFVLRNHHPGRVHLLLVRELRGLLGLHVIRNLVVQVLDDHRQQRHHALGLADAVGGLGEGRVRGLELGDLELWFIPLLSQRGALDGALDGAEARGVLVVVLGECVAHLHQQLDGILVVLLSLDEVAVVLRADVRRLVHVRVGLLDHLPGLRDHRLLLFNLSLKLVDLGLVALDLPGQVQDR